MYGADRAGTHEAVVRGISEGVGVAGHSIEVIPAHGVRESAVRFRLARPFDYAHVKSFDATYGRVVYRRIQLNSPE